MTGNPGIPEQLSYELRYIDVTVASLVASGQLFEEIVAAQGGTDTKLDGMDSGSAIIMTSHIVQIRGLETWSIGIGEQEQSLCAQL